MKRAFGLLVVVVFVVSLTGWAQDTATIVGNVTDTSGAVIPGAKVTVSNPEKGFKRELVSNAAGAYTASSIPIGNYVVTAEAAGFEKLMRSEITLTVGQIQRVDLQLAVGQVSQEVTVTGNVPHVQTETSALSDVVTGTQIQNLELNGRNFVALYALVPGAVTDNTFDPTQTGINNFAFVSFNGNRMEYQNIEIDGSLNSDEGSGGVSIETEPSIDSIAEFRISTSNYGADQGRHAGAQIEVATKSGTKDFHGDAYEYVRNDVFDANNWFQNRQIAPPGGNAPKTPLKWNDYGYTLGGPVYIPNHYNTDKSKTFFFWSEEWRRYRQGSTLSANVPTARMRNGDFSECDSASPNFNAIAASGCVVPSVNGVNYDTVQQMPGFNQQAFTNATDLLNGLVPLPNNGVDGWITSPTIPTNWREEQLRVDQNISDKTTVFVRYTQDAWNQTVIPSLWTGATFDTITTPFDGPSKNAVLHVTHSFKPNLMNEFVMGYNVDHIALANQVGPDSVSHNINRPSDFVMNHLFAANNSNPLLPAISVGGGTPFGFFEDAGNHPWFNSNPIITWKDNVAWTHGAHTMKVGFYLQKYRKNEQYGTDTQGILTFNASGPLTSGNALADMFLGAINQYQEGTQTVNGLAAGGYPKGHWRSTDFEPYFQDDWKVSRKLTLNLGVRYYYFLPIHDVSQPQTVDSGFLPNLYNPANEAQLDINGNIIPGSGHDYTTFGNGLVSCGHNGIAPGCRKGDFNTVAPRFGFAFDPVGNGKTVIRGGYGLYYESGNGNESNTEGGEGNPPVELSPSGFNILGYNNIVPGALGSTSYIPIPYAEAWGSVQQYNLNFQHEFSGNNLLTVSYVGTLGRHLARNRNINQIPIGVGMVNVPSLANTQGCDAQGNCDVQTILMNQIQTNTSFFAPFRTYGTMGQKENTAVSDYNGLQANFRHAFGHGLTFQAAYTWSHNIDDSTSTYYQTGVDDSNLSRWRSTSSLNRTHVFVANYVYDLPFFKNASSGLVRQALGGWTISGITSFFTGEPVDFGCGVQGFSTGIGGGVRCNTIGNLKINKGVTSDPQFGPTPTWFDPNTFAEPLLAQLPANNQPGMFGYMDRNFLTGPGRNNWDLALLKNFTTPWFGAEHSTIQFRLETFNTFNHPQWNGINIGCSGSPNNDGSPAFGRPCGGTTYNLGNGEVSSAWPARVMQMGLKFIF